MQLLFDARPQPALRPFVRTFAQRDYSLSTAVTEPSLPRVEPILAFLFGAGLTASFPDGTALRPPKVSIVGPNLCPGVSLSMSDRLDLFAVFFQPAGFSELFGVPISAIVNTNHDAALISAGMVSLWERLSEAPSFAARVAIAETYLLGRIERATRSDDMQEANAILRSRGMVRVDALAAARGLSVRQFERRFFAAVGTGPKAFSRVARFQSALDAKVAAPGRTWCDIAHAFGYHDQMHLVHEFERIGGLAPRSLVEYMGHSRPPSLTAETDE